LTTVLPLLVVVPPHDVCGSVQLASQIVLAWKSVFEGLVMQSEPAE